MENTEREREPFLLFSLPRSSVKISNCVTPTTVGKMFNTRYLLVAALTAPILCAQIPAHADLFGKVKDAIDRKGGEEKRDRDNAKDEAKGNAVAGAIKAAQGDKFSQMEAAVYLSKAALAAQRGKLKPNTKANGTIVGLGALKWGMNSAQVKATKIGGKGAVAVSAPDKNEKSFEYRGLKIYAKSPRLYTAQVWLRKDQLNFAELRPMNESQSSSMLGASGADDYFAEMTGLSQATWNNWSSAARELRAKSLESTYNYQVPVATRTQYMGEKTILLGFDSQGGAVFGGAPDYQTVTTYENRQRVKSKPLPFSIVQDDWKSTKGVAYRIALLKGAGTNGAKNMGVARWQAQREGGAFPFLILDERSIRDTKGVMKDVEANYNVFPHTLH